MSSENVEIVRRQIEDYLAGDVEAALAAFDPEVVFDASVRPDGSVYHGRDGANKGMTDWTSTWENYSLEVEELIDAGDKVLFVGRESGQGRGSGLEIDHALWAVLTLRDGLIVRWEVFLEPKPAYAAAGLEG
jgi:ketosteroid isomerase-like protein